MRVSLPAQGDLREAHSPPPVRSDPLQRYVSGGWLLKQHRFPPAKTTMLNGAMLSQTLNWGRVNEHNQASKRC